MRNLIIILSIGLLISCNSYREPDSSEMCLNGDNWTFKPIKIPFYGYELDAGGRWKNPERSHEFIICAINNSSNLWDEKDIRVPMSWSSVVSDPGELDAKGDFDFPYFWQYVHKGEYTSTFKLPDSFEEKRTKLYFGSVNFACWVYINGKLIKAEGDDKTYTHLNKLPFEIDITDYIHQAPMDNELKVLVHDFTFTFKGEFPNEDHPVSGINYPLGDRCDYYNKDRGWRNIDNGIIGDVILKSVPQINVSDIYIKTDVRNSRIEAEITLFNQSDDSTEVLLGGFISDDGDMDKEFQFEHPQTISLQANEKKTLIFSQSWEDPQLWWPYDPHLYQFNVTVGRKTIHRERFGFRQLDVITSKDADKRGFYLNGIRVRLMGESMEPTWKDNYSEGVSGSMILYNPEYWSHVIDVSKDLNINILRLHRGMSIENQIDIADEKGMMIMVESTINNGNHKGGYGTIENQKKAIRDMICSYRNHPSIVYWSLANETPYHEEWAEEALIYDDTRPFTATQLVPRNYPSKYISTAACAYSMGLSNYDSSIYNRHDKHWKEKLLYVYEDNACYDEQLMNDRISTVQKGLSIFRGHRTTGYEMIFTFYTWQKLFGQAQDENEKHLFIDWPEDKIRQKGYRPDFALMPLFDTWTNIDTPRTINPVLGLKDLPYNFWQRTFSPVAVFDYEYDKRTDISAQANPYIAKMSENRILTIHNDDMIDTTKTISVSWHVMRMGTDQEISEGSFNIDVPLGGVRQKEINIEVFENSEVRVIYRASKSGKERFEETIYLGADKILAKSLLKTSKMTSDTLIINAVSEAVLSKGFFAETYSGSLSSKVLLNRSPEIGQYVQFNPWITEDGEYDLYMYIPKEMSVNQIVSIQHDSHNKEIVSDFSKTGWIKLTKEPIKMEAGKLENNIKIIVSDPSEEIIVDALKIQKSKG